MSLAVFVVLGVILLPNAYAYPLYNGAPFRVAEEVYVTQLNNVSVCVIDGVIYQKDDPIRTLDACESCICHPPGFACRRNSCDDTPPGCLRLPKHDYECCNPHICDNATENSLEYRIGEDGVPILPLLSAIVTESPLETFTTEDILNRIVSAQPSTTTDSAAISNQPSANHDELETSKNQDTLDTTPENNAKETTKQPAQPEISIDEANDTNAPTSTEYSLLGDEKSVSEHSPSILVDELENSNKEQAATQADDTESSTAPDSTPNLNATNRDNATTSVDIDEAINDKLTNATPLEDITTDVTTSTAPEIKPNLYSSNQDNLTNPVNEDGEETSSITEQTEEATNDRTTKATPLDDNTTEITDTLEVIATSSESVISKNETDEPVIRGKSNDDIVYNTELRPGHQQTDNVSSTVPSEEYEPVGKEQLVTSGLPDLENVTQVVNYTLNFIDESSTTQEEFAVTFQPDGDNNATSNATAAEPRFVDQYEQETTLIVQNSSTEYDSTTSQLFTTTIAAEPLENDHLTTSFPDDESNSNQEIQQSTTVSNAIVFPLVPDGNEADRGMKPRQTPSSAEDNATTKFKPIAYRGVPGILDENQKLVLDDSSVTTTKELTEQSTQTDISTHIPLTADAVQNSDHLHDIQQPLQDAVPSFSQTFVDETTDETPQESGLGIHSQTKKENPDLEENREDAVTHEMQVGADGKISPEVEIFDSRNEAADQKYARPIALKSEAIYDVLHNTPGSSESGSSESQKPDASIFTSSDEVATTTFSAVRENLMTTIDTNVEESLKGRKDSSILVDISDEREGTPVDTSDPAVVSETPIKGPTDEVYDVSSQPDSSKNHDTTPEATSSLPDETRLAAELYTSDESGRTKATFSTITTISFVTNEDETTASMSLSTNENLATDVASLVTGENKPSEDDLHGTRQAAIDSIKYSSLLENKLENEETTITTTSLTTNEDETTLATDKDLAADASLATEGNKFSEIESSNATTEATLEGRKDSSVLSDKPESEDTDLTATSSATSEDETTATTSLATNEDLATDAPSLVTEVHKPSVEESNGLSTEATLEGRKDSSIIPDKSEDDEATIAATSFETNAPTSLATNENLATDSPSPVTEVHKPSEEEAHGISTEATLEGRKDSSVLPDKSEDDEATIATTSFETNAATSLANEDLATDAPSLVTEDPKPSEEESNRIYTEATIEGRKDTSVLPDKSEDDETIIAAQPLATNEDEIMAATSLATEAATDVTSLATENTERESSGSTTEATLQGRKDSSVLPDNLDAEEKTIATTLLATNEHETTEPAPLATDEDLATDAPSLGSEVNKQSEEKLSKTSTEASLEGRKDTTATSLETNKDNEKNEATSLSTEGNKPSEEESTGITIEATLEGKKDSSVLPDKSEDDETSIAATSHATNENETTAATSLTTDEGPATDVTTLATDSNERESSVSTIDATLQSRKDSSVLPDKSDDRDGSNTVPPIAKNEDETSDTTTLATEGSTPSDEELRLTTTEAELESRKDSSVLPDKSEDEVTTITATSLGISKDETTDNTSFEDIVTDRAELTTEGTEPSEKESSETVTEAALERRKDLSVLSDKSEVDETTTVAPSFETNEGGITIGTSLATDEDVTTGTPSLAVEGNNPSEEDSSRTTEATLEGRKDSSVLPDEPEVEDITTTVPLVETNEGETVAVTSLATDDVPTSDAAATTDASLAAEGYKPPEEESSRTTEATLEGRKDSAVLTDKPIDEEATLTSTSFAQNEDETTAATSLATNEAPTIDVTSLATEDKKHSEDDSSGTTETALQGRKDSSVLLDNSNDEKITPQLAAEGAATAATLLENAITDATSLPIEGNEVLTEDSSATTEAPLNGRKDTLITSNSEDISDDSASDSTPFVTEGSELPESEWSTTTETVLDRKKKSSAPPITLGAEPISADTPVVTGEDTTFASIPVTESMKDPEHELKMEKAPTKEVDEVTLEGRKDSSVLPDNREENNIATVTSAETTATTSIEDIATVDTTLATESSTASEEESRLTTTEVALEGRKDSSVLPDELQDEDTTTVSIALRTSEDESTMTTSSEYIATDATTLVTEGSTPSEEESRLTTIEAVLEGRKDSSVLPDKLEDEDTTTIRITIGTSEAESIATTSSGDKATDATTLITEGSTSEEEESRLTTIEAVLEGRKDSSVLPDKLEDDDTTTVSIALGTSEDKSTATKSSEDITTDATTIVTEGSTPSEEESRLTTTEVPLEGRKDSSVLPDKLEDDDTTTVSIALRTSEDKSTATQSSEDITTDATTILTEGSTPSEEESRLTTTEVPLEGRKDSSVLPDKLEDDDTTTVSIALRTSEDKSTATQSSEDITTDATTILTEGSTPSEEESRLTTTEVPLEGRKDSSVLPDKLEDEDTTTVLIVLGTSEDEVTVTKSSEDITTDATTIVTEGSTLSEEESRLATLEAALEGRKDSSVLPDKLEDEDTTTVRIVLGTSEDEIVATTSAEDITTDATTNVAEGSTLSGEESRLATTEAALEGRKDSSVLPDKLGDEDTTTVSKGTSEDEVTATISSVDITADAKKELTTNLESITTEASLNNRKDSSILLDDSEENSEQHEDPSVATEDKENISLEVTTETINLQEEEVTTVSLTPELEEEKTASPEIKDTGLSDPVVTTTDNLSAGNVTTTTVSNVEITATQENEQVTSNELLESVQKAAAALEDVAFNELAGKASPDVFITKNESIANNETDINDTTISISTLVPEQQQDEFSTVSPEIISLNESRDSATTIVVDKLPITEESESIKTFTDRPSPSLWTELFTTLFPLNPDTEERS